MGNLRVEHLDGFYRGRVGEQALSLGHERLRGGAHPMRLPGWLVHKGVNHAERSRPQLQGKPQRCTGLLHRHIQGRFQEYCYICLLFGFRFESSEQSVLEYFAFSCLGLFEWRAG